MIKKLDKLVVKAFIGPFIATFFIILFVLILQFFWLYLDDIVGKGLDVLTLGRFIILVCATLVPLALPLSILISSIMTFGSLGETFELVAIKSAGISLTRFMQPLFIISLFLSGAAFLFNNNIIPVASLKQRTMLTDIVYTKPAFDIKEGVFYDKIAGYVIKIGKKEKDNVTIKDIIIYERSDNGAQDNITVATSGKMRVTPDKHSLEFNLEDGWRYEEQGDTGTQTTYIRLGFKEYKKVFDLSSFQFNKTEDSTYKNNFRMLSVRQLDSRVDSLEKLCEYFRQRIESDITSQLSFTTYLDTTRGKAPVRVKKIRSMKEIIPDSLRNSVRENALGKLTGIKPTLDMDINEYKSKQKDARFHLIEWHRKFSMSVACLVLFLIGAPLGSIVRKGGIGTPVLIAVLFFVIFFLLNNFGEKFVKEDVLKPGIGMWMATFILVPVGFFLTWKAMRDSQLFNKEAYFRLYKKIFQRKK